MMVVADYLLAAAMYISILMTLPNRKYYQRIAVFDSRQLLMMLFRTSVYSFLELISLFRLDWMLRRQLRFSPIVQLSFRLETQWRAVQAALVMYVVYIIESMLEHHGTLACHPSMPSTFDGPG